MIIETDGLPMRSVAGPQPAPRFAVFLRFWYTADTGLLLAAPRGLEYVEPVAGLAALTS